MRLEWGTWRLFLVLSLCAILQTVVVIAGAVTCPAPVDVTIELEHGRGTLNRGNDGNYDLKVLPGESISLICRPACIEGEREYQWKRDATTVLYSSTNGAQISESDPDYGRIRFEPGSPAKWDQVWRLIFDDLVEDDVLSFTCGSSLYGQSAVDVTVTFAAIETVEVSFNGEGEFSPNKQSITLKYDECNIDLTQGKWTSFGDHCYQLGLDLLTQEAAETRCSDRGALLTSIHSADEQAILGNLLKASGVATDAWIGLHDRDNDETYVFTDGTSVDYTNWDRYEPNWRGRDLCVYTGTDDWIDNPCDSQRPYICKKAKESSAGTGGQSAQGTTYPSIVCQFYGENPVGRVTWYVNDATFLPHPSIPTVTREPGRVYELGLTKGLASGGSYRCVADDDREGALEVKVDVNTVMSLTDGEAKFALGTEGALNTLVATKGDNITIKCKIELLPVNPTVKWLKTSFGEEEVTELTEDADVTFSQNLEEKEWSVTLTDVSKDEAGIYTCESYDGSGGRVGTDTVYATIFSGAAKYGELQISLTEDAIGVTTIMDPGQRDLPVSRSVGKVTLTCLSYFWADSIKWLNSYGSELDSYYYDHTPVDTIPGGEKKTTFNYQGYSSDGEYRCEARDTTTGESVTRTINIVTVATTNIALNEGGRSKYIEKRTPDGENIITVFEGDTLSLTCTVKYPDDYFKYLKWGIGSDEYRASAEYTVYSWHEEYGRVSFTEDTSKGTSTMTLTDVKKSDAKEIMCQISDYPRDVVRLIVADDNEPCPYSCYPETGSWTGDFGPNCFSDSNKLCDNEAYCPNLADETNCPGLESGPDRGCDGLDKPDNGYIFVSSYTPGSVATYSCKPGYVPSQGEAEPRICEKRAIDWRGQPVYDWTGQQPSCVLNIVGSSGCPPLTSPGNGQLFDVGTNFGDSNYIKCNSGYTLSGDSVRNCQDTGNWTGEPATCEAAHGAEPVITLISGNAETAVYRKCPAGWDRCYNITVISVRQNAGPITIACRMPTKTTAPYWRVNDYGTYYDIRPVIGDYSVSETIKDLEWRFTMGLSEDGPLRPGTQTEMDCYASEQSLSGEFRIDVIGDKPFADLSTTKVAITVSKGLKIEETIEQPSGGAVSNIQISPGSTISLTCKVTNPGAIAKKHIHVRWTYESPWGDGTSGRDSVISIGDNLWLSLDERITLTVDEQNMEWTLNIRDVTVKYNVTFACSVIPDAVLWDLDQAIVAKAHVTVKAIPDYRRDRKCGPDYLTPTGEEAVCPGECCSTDGECGDSDDHCVTKLYKDYRDACSYGTSDPSSDIDWKTSENACIVLIKQKTSFYNARDRCVELGATLSSIHNDDEQQIHLNWMTELGAKRAWIGLTDEDSEGSFVNIDGTSNDFEFWARNEPKYSTGEEDCTHLKLTDDGKWKAVPCTDTMSFFCRRRKQNEDKLIRPTWPPTTVETGTCEPLTTPLCADIGYEYAYFPNFMNHTTQDEAALNLQPFTSLIQTGCSTDLQPFLCSIFAPKCTPGESSPDIPSRDKCQSALDGCGPLMEQFGYVWPESLACEVFPKNGATGGEVHPGNEGTVELPPGGGAIQTDGTCEPLTIQSCADIGYEYAYFPNFMNHTTQDDAALNLQSFTPLVQFGCSADLKPFLCSVFAPKCTPRESLPELPSRDKCQSARTGCEPIMKQFGYGWPEYLACEALFGSGETGGDVRPGNEGTGEVPPGGGSTQTGVLSIDVTSAQQPYTVNEMQIPGVGTFKQIQVTEGDTIRLTCRAATKVDGIAWARESGPISYNDALLSSNPNIQLDINTEKQEWTLTIEGVSKADEGQWICGTLSGSSLTIANLTFSDIADGPGQPSHKSGTCEPLTIPLCADIGYENAYFPNFMNHTTQDEADLNLQPFTPLIQSGCSADLKQFMCSIFAPRCTPGESSPELPSRDICQSALAGCEPLMEQFGYVWPASLACEAFPKDGETDGEVHPGNEGTGELSPGGGASQTEGTCEPLTIPICADIGYEYTYFPNFMNHTTQDEAALNLQSFTPLVQFGCSADLKPFLCSVFAPKCTPGESSPELPSTDTCLSARAGCEPIMKQFGYGWPEFLACEALLGGGETGGEVRPGNEGTGEVSPDGGAIQTEVLSIDVTSAEQPYTVNEIQVPGVGTFKQIQVTEGDTISLTCRAATSVDGIAWARESGPISYNDVVLSSNPNIQLDINTDKLEWTLTIEGVSKAEEGQWICGTLSGSSLTIANLTFSDIAGGGPGQPSLQPGLSIDIAAELPFTEDQISTPIGIFKQFGVTRGDTVSLTCKAATSDITTAGIGWTNADYGVSFNDQLLRVDPKIRLDVNTDKLEWKITIIGVGEEHEGQWICASVDQQSVTVANLTLTVNDATTDGSSGNTQPESSPKADITVDIQAELPFTIEGESTIPNVGTFKQLRVTDGDMVTLTCRTTASDTESIVWTHENNPISFNGHKIVAMNDNIDFEHSMIFSTWTVTIDKVSKAEDGQWTCAKSGGPVVSASFVNITVLDSPSSDETTTAVPTTDKMSTTILAADEMSTAVSVANDTSTMAPVLNETSTASQGEQDGGSTYKRPGICEPLSIPLCTDIGYQDTFLPNFFNITNQDDAAVHLQQFSPLVQVGCSDDLKPFLCSMFAPKCINDGVQSLPELPSKAQCQSARSGCKSLMTAFGYAWPVVLDCDKLPSAESLEPEEPTDIGSCQNLTLPLCEDLGYQYTVFPNFANHTNQAEAYLDLQQFAPLVKTECSPDFKPFICSVFAPKCTPGEPSPELPSKELCQSARNDCGPLMTQFGFDWPAMLDCDALPDILETDGGETEDIPTQVKVIQAAERRCQEISQENLDLCPELTYVVTTMPNMFGHQTQEEATQALNSLMQEHPDLCLQKKQLMCASHLPACKETAEVSYTTIITPVLPCLSICEESFKQCSGIKWPGPDETSCAIFPKEDASYEKCWQPASSVFGSNSQCEKVPSEFCRDLGFTHTKFPNELKHTNAEEAMDAFEDILRENIFRSGCSQELAYFACGAVFPPCEDDVVFRPCYEVCRRIWKDCKDFSAEKNDIFRCGKYYPEFEEGSSTCLIDMFPPSNTPTFIDYATVVRNPTSIEFAAGVDEANVDEIHAALYAIDSPESHFVSSTYLTANELMMGAHYASLAFGTEPNILYESQVEEVKETPLLDPDTSYIIVAQAKNRYGFGPIGVLVVPKYDEENVFLSVDNIGPTRISERGVAVLKVPNLPKQAICVNLMSDVYPVWFDEYNQVVTHKVIRRESEPRPYPEQTQQDVQGFKMTLLEIVTDRVGGPYQCGETSTSTAEERASVDLMTTVTCVESTHYICQEFSKYTYLPNVLGHYDAQTAELASLEFLPLLQAQCVTSNVLLAQFICATYAPDGSCDTTDLSETRLPPCREVCVRIQQEYAACMAEIKFAWPHAASCDRFPSRDDGTCMDLPGLDQGNNETSHIPDNNGETAPSEDMNNGSTVGGKECGFKPRRYDVTDIGKDCYFRGWADVQGQGAANDYCRVVSADGGFEYLSCALAGLKGENEYNFNSPDPGESWFEYGYEETWYMKDEDEDGKDDYCRCVGKTDSHVSCMKAGDAGFIGFYDFNVTSKPSPCNEIKVNPFFGEPLEAP